MPTLLRLWALGLLVFAGLHAQTPPTANAPADSVSVEFVMYGWNNPLPALYYTPRLKTAELEDVFSLTPAYRYTGPATLHFYTTSPKPASDKSEPPPPAATVTFPPGATKFILVTAALPSGRFQIYVVPEDDASTPPPYIRLHNFTQHTLMVGFDGTNTVQLAPASNSTIKPRGQATLLRVAQLIDGQWRRRFNNVAELSPEGRRNIILAPAEGRPVSMYSLPLWPRNDDTPAAPEAPATPLAAARTPR